MTGAISITCFPLHLLHSCKNIFPSLRVNYKVVSIF
jgi:hypothetical protein